MNQLGRINIGRRGMTSAVVRGIRTLRCAGIGGCWSWLRKVYRTLAFRIVRADEIDGNLGLSRDQLCMASGAAGGVHCTSILRYLASRHNREEPVGVVMPRECATLLASFREAGDFDSLVPRTREWNTDTEAAHQEIVERGGGNNIPDKLRSAEGSNGVNSRDHQTN